MSASFSNDPARYPTTIFLNHQPLIREALLESAHAIQAVLDRHRWRTFTLLAGESESELPDEMRLLSRLYATFFGSTRSRYQIYHESFNSASEGSLAEALRRSQKQCRVILILTSPDGARSLMRTATALGMDNGEYIFLYPGKVKEFEGTPHSQIYRSLIIVGVSGVQSMWRAQHGQKVKLEEDEQAALDVGRSNLETMVFHFIWTIAKILNGTRFSVSQLSGSAFVHTFRESFSFQQPEQLSPISFYKLNMTSGYFEEAFLFNRSTSSLVAINRRLSDSWVNCPTGVLPPLDRPICGYQNELCRTESGVRYQFQSVIIGTVVGCSLLTVILFYCLWPRTTTSTFFSCDFLLGKRKPATDQLTIASAGVYKSHDVWRQTFSFVTSQPMEEGPLKNLLKEVRATHHDNVGRFSVSSPRPPSLCCGSWDEVQFESCWMTRKIKLDTSYRRSLIYELLSPDDTSLSAHSVETFWKAPECIENPRSPGTQAADVFSTAVVLCEIVTNTAPYGIRLDDPEEVRAGFVYLLDPSVPRFNLAVLRSNPATHVLTTILAQCLSMEEVTRPTIKVIYSRLERLFPRQTVVETIMMRLQTQFEEMESQVAARTNQLLLEAARIDDILKEMIPAIFVKQLRNRQPIEAEHFESVTVMFNGIIGFDHFVTSSEAADVVVLLNRVYSTFDDLMGKHDVYKVETIADSYMVVSGLPVRNGQKHAREIANLSVDFLAASMGTTVLHIPGNDSPMQLKIGIHSGPCAAGVVGLRMPRYCLFGDTVNTASRMASSAEASKIHMTEATKSLLMDEIDEAHDWIMAPFRIERRGVIEVKGKGDTETFWLVPNIMTWFHSAIPA
ncbi:Guanylyl cyclase GC-E [Hypsibius exemplaris]|uniref:Guanylyl cyclase GC-E n=1 Tax=Hypsibius exemplaris TaxID=2072580 RepID=A0A1W0W8J2_HYPEX|nr:Guanylyl cyclase GC-E [Hypsibius exemplaris]